MDQIKRLQSENDDLISRNVKESQENKIHQKEIKLKNKYLQDQINDLKKKYFEEQSTRI